MAKRSFKVATWTTSATADAATLGSNTYVALQGGSGTQRLNIIEVNTGGQSGSSAPSIMLLSRDSTVGATLTALTTGQSDAALDPSTAALALPPAPFTAATTNPQRSATLGLLNISFNAFGGAFRWVAAPGEEIGVLGNTASLGEVSYSAFTGSTSAAIGTHIIYEPL